MGTALFIIGGLVFATVIAIWVTGIQSSEIDKCIELKRTHNRLLAGELKIKDIPNELLIRLRNPKFTHICIGGVGPFYICSFDVWNMVKEELLRRRSK